MAITPQQTRSREVGLRRVRTFLGRRSALHAGSGWSVGDDGAAMTVMELLRGGDLVDRRRAGLCRAPTGHGGRGAGGGRVGHGVRPAGAAGLGGRVREHRLVDQLAGRRCQPVAARRWRPPDARRRRTSRSSRCWPSPSASPSAPGRRPARRARPPRPAPSSSPATPSTDRSRLALGAWAAGYAACALLWVARRLPGRSPAPSSGPSSCPCSSSLRSRSLLALAAPASRVDPSWPDRVCADPRGSPRRCGAPCARASREPAALLGCGHAVICLVLLVSALRPRSATCRASSRRG